jgi:iron complex outermembrane receptor protein
MASLWSKYQVRGGPAKGLSFGLGVNYVGERAGGRDSVVRSFPFPAYTSVSGLVSFASGKNKFALNVENLTDERYIQQGLSRLADPGEHRGFRLTYTREF